MFCQLEVLRDCLPPSVRRTLDELPESLDETYERTSVSLFRNHHHLLYYGHSAFAVERPGIPFLVPSTCIQCRQTPRHHPPTLSGYPSRCPKASRTRTACQSQDHKRRGTTSFFFTNTQAVTPSNGQDGPHTCTHDTNARMGPSRSRALPSPFQQPSGYNPY